MGQRQTYNSIHKPQRSQNETIGFNQDGPHTEGAMKQEFLIPGIANSRNSYGRDGDITYALPA